MAHNCPDKKETPKSGNQESVVGTKVSDKKWFLIPPAEGESSVQVKNGVT